MNALIVALVFVSLVVMAAWYDKRFLRIPNIFPLAIVALYLGVHFVFGFGAMQWPNLWHFLLALLAGMLLFRFQWIGGGDAKLYAACALWFSLSHAILLFFLVSLSGGLIAAMLLATRRIKLRGLERGQKLDRRIPYGLAIAMGVAMAVAIVSPQGMFPEWAVASR